MVGQIGDYRCCPNPHTHAGIDISNGAGTDIVASYRGTARVATSSTAGLYIEISHANGYVTRYLHLSQALVGNGQRVERGQHIGEMGCTGTCGGPHLHYEVRNAGCSAYGLAGVCNINPVFPRGGSIGAKAAMPMDFLLVANPDIAPFANELGFVARQYSDFLRRPISGPEASARIDQLWSGTSGTSVIREISESAEADAKVTAIARLYYAGFNRYPDTSGARSFMGKPLRNVAGSMINSNEGTYLRTASAENVIRRIFLFAFHSAPTRDEITLWSTYMQNEGRPALLVAVAQDNRTRLVHYADTTTAAIYMAMLNRGPDSSGFNYWQPRVEYAHGYATQEMIGVIRGTCEYKRHIGVAC